MDATHLHALGLTLEIERRRAGRSLYVLVEEVCPQCVAPSTWQSIELESFLACSQCGKIMTKLNRTASLASMGMHFDTERFYAEDEALFADRLLARFDELAIDPLTVEIYRSELFDFLRSFAVGAVTNVSYWSLLDQGVANHA